MKITIIIIQIVLVAALAVNMFIWLIAHASGHKIPSKTDLVFGLRSLFLIIALLLIRVPLGNGRRN